MAESGDVADIERALVAIRRSQTRRALARRQGPRPGPPDAVYELVDAVAAADGPRTVTELASALGTDQPRASRLAAAAVEAGLLRRQSDQADGRRSPLTLTAAGRRALAAIADHRRSVVAGATAAWSEPDRATFARLLTRFVNDFSAVISRPPAP